MRQKSTMTESKLRTEYQRAVQNDTTVTPLTFVAWLVKRVYDEGFDDGHELGQELGYQRGFEDGDEYGYELALSHSPPPMQPFCLISGFDDDN